MVGGGGILRRTGPGLSRIAPRPTDRAAATPVQPSMQVSRGLPAPAAGHGFAPLTRPIIDTATPAKIRPNAA